MRICIPIAESRGLLSPLVPRVEASTMFLLVDTATLAYRTIPHVPGVAADAERAPDLAGEVVDAFIVSAAGGIGVAHALMNRGVPVYAAPAGRVADALAALIAGRLDAVQPRTPADERAAGRGAPAPPTSS